MNTYNQFNGKGYTNNVWQSSENQNLTFSFLLVDIFSIQKDLPILNMWVAISIIRVLSKWQIHAQIKWPNDIILNSKKIGGILIQTKIAKNQIKFVVVGVGLNIYQTDFNNLPNASSIILCEPNFNKQLQDCLTEILHHLEEDYQNFLPSNYLDIRATYHHYLFKLDQVAIYEIKGKQYNGILRQINEEGNAVIDIEHLGRKTFRHKEVKLQY